MDFVLLLLIIFFGVFSVGLAMIIISDRDAYIDSFKDPVFIICFVVFVISALWFEKLVNTEPDEIKVVYVSDMIDDAMNVVKFDKPMKITKITFHKDWCIIVDNPKYYVENIK